MGWVSLQKLNPNFRGFEVGGFLDGEVKFERALVECYGDEVLRVIHPEMMESLGKYCLSWTMGCDWLWEVDRVVHWLVGGILWD